MFCLTIENGLRVKGARKRTHYDGVVNYIYFYGRIMRRCWRWWISFGKSSKRGKIQIRRINKESHTIAASVYSFFVFGNYFIAFCSTFYSFCSVLESFYPLFYLFWSYLNNFGK